MFREAVGGKPLLPFIKYLLWPEPRNWTPGLPVAQADAIINNQNRTSPDIITTCQSNLQNVNKIYLRFIKQIWAWIWIVWTLIWIVWTRQWRQIWAWIWILYKLWTWQWQQVRGCTCIRLTRFWTGHWSVGKTCIFASSKQRTAKIITDQTYSG